MMTDSKGVEQEQVWHQVSDAAVGSELMEQTWSGIVLQKNPNNASLGFDLAWSKCAAKMLGLELKSFKKNKQASSSFNLHQNPQHASSGVKKRL